MLNVCLSSPTEFMDNERTYCDIKWIGHILSFMSLLINGAFFEGLWSQHKEIFNTIWWTGLVAFASISRTISLLSAISTSEDSSIVEHIFMFWNFFILSSISINKIQWN